MKKPLLSLFALTGCFIAVLFWKPASVKTFAAMTKINDYKNESEVEEAKKALYKDYLKKIKNQKKEIESGKITLNGQTMKFSMKTIGDPDKNGYPLYFGLRGGGVEDDTKAEEQYEFMQNYYSRNIKNGMYIVTQPVYACWNEHYLPEMFPFYDRLIEDAVAFCDADPNRVYVMGFLTIMQNSTEADTSMRYSFIRVAITIAGMIYMIIHNLFIRVIRLQRG